MNLKNILILLALFLTINISVYIYTDLGSKDRINIVLKEDIKDLETHFNILNLSPILCVKKIRFIESLNKGL